MTKLEILKKEMDTFKNGLEKDELEYYNRMKKCMENVTTILEYETSDEVINLQLGKITYKEFVDRIVKIMADNVESSMVKEYQYMKTKQGYKLKNISEFIVTVTNYMKRISEFTTEEKIDILEFPDGVQDIEYLAEKTVEYFIIAFERVSKKLQWSIVQ